MIAVRRPENVPNSARKDPKWPQERDNAPNGPQERSSSPPKRAAHDHDAPILALRRLKWVRNSPKHKLKCTKHTMFCYVFCLPAFCSKQPRVPKKSCSWPRKGLRMAPRWPENGHMIALRGPQNAPNNPRKDPKWPQERDKAPNGAQERFS